MAENPEHSNPETELLPAFTRMEGVQARMLAAALKGNTAYNPSKQIALSKDEAELAVTNREWPWSDIKKAFIGESVSFWKARSGTYDAHLDEWQDNFKENLKLGKNKAFLEKFFEAETNYKKNEDEINYLYKTYVFREGAVVDPHVFVYTIRQRFPDYKNHLDEIQWLAQQLYGPEVGGRVIAQQIDWMSRSNEEIAADFTGERHNKLTNGETELLNKFQKYLGVGNLYETTQQSSEPIQQTAAPSTPSVETPAKVEPTVEPAKVEPTVEPAKVEPTVEPTVEPAKVEPTVEPAKVEVPGTAAEAETKLETAGAEGTPGAGGTAAPISSAVPAGTEVTATSPNIKTLDEVKTQLTAFGLRPDQLDQIQIKEKIENRGTPQEKKVTVYTLPRLNLPATEDNVKTFSQLGESLKNQGASLEITDLALNIPKDKAAAAIDLGNYQLQTLKIMGEPAGKIDINNAKAGKILVSKNISVRLQPADLKNAPLGEIKLLADSTLAIDEKHLPDLTQTKILIGRGAKLEVVPEKASSYSLTGEQAEYKLVKNPNGTFTLEKAETVIQIPPASPPPSTAAAPAPTTASPSLTVETAAKTIVPNEFINVTQKAADYLSMFYQNVKKEKNIGQLQREDKIVAYYFKEKKFNLDGKPNHPVEFYKSFFQIWEFVRSNGGNVPIGYIYDPSGVEELVYATAQNKIKKIVFDLNTKSFNHIDLPTDELGKVKLFKELNIHNPTGWQEVQDLFKVSPPHPP